MHFLECARNFRGHWFIFIIIVEKAFSKPKGSTCRYEAVLRQYDGQVVGDGDFCLPFKAVYTIAEMRLLAKEYVAKKDHLRLELR